MSKRFVYLFLLLQLFVGLQIARAQQYPVQVIPVLTPPYSIYLADYTTPDANLQLIVQLRELDRPQYKVKLRVTIEGQGITIRTKSAYNPPAIVLQGGISEVLYGIDIKNYFNPDNLEFSGITKQEFLKTGALPEGYYTFKFEVIDYIRNVVVSNTGLTNAWLILNDPPILNLPFNNDKVVATDPQNILFSWTPRHTASPNAAFTTEYEFTMVELYPVDRNPNDAMRVGKPIFQIKTGLTSLNYSITEPLLIPGRKYAFRIRAFAEEGRDLFKNNGYSEVFVFQFGDACIPPTGVKTEALDEGRIKVTWDVLDIHNGYSVHYRKKGNTTWQDQSVLVNSSVFPGLAPNTAYEFQVRGSCGTIQGQYSPIAETKTLQSNPKEFACGSNAPKIEIKTTPLQKKLEVDDIIKTADFEVSVTELSENSDGSYKGKGKAFLPWFNFATVGVKFSNIRVNEEYRVYSGNVTTIYTKSSKFIAQIDASGDDDKKDDSQQGADSKDNNLIIEDTVNVNVDVKEIIVDVQKNPDVILVVAADGTTTEVPREKDGEKGYKDTVVKDANGDTWIVSKDGTVTQGASAAPPTAVASLDDVKFNVGFKAFTDQEYGFDAKEEYLGDYETIKIRGKDYVVFWKSVETGRLDRVVATAPDQATFPAIVGFKSNGTNVPAQASSEPSEKQVYVTGKTDGTQESVSAYVIVKEAGKDQQEVELGKLNVKTYDKLRKKLIIVPVNNAAAPDAASLQTELNKIYQQAVVEWDVEIADKFEYEVEDLKGIDSEESDFLSSFPEKMQIFNRTYRNSIFVDNSAYYVFLVNGTGSKRTGFMPFKRKYGYIFTDNLKGSNITTTIAHELGHGAFRLRHTFSKEAFLAAEGKTTNLMDYNNGTGLKKFQWDLIHNPENINGWLEGDDESAAYALNGFEDVKDAQSDIELDVAWFYFLHNTRFVKIGFIGKAQVQGHSVIKNGSKYTLGFNKSTGKFTAFFLDDDLKKLTRTEADGIITYSGVTAATRSLTKDVDFRVLDEGELASHTPSWLATLEKRKDISKDRLDNLITLINQITDEALREYIEKNSQPPPNSPCGPDPVNIANFSNTYSNECWDALIQGIAGLLHNSSEKIQSLLALIDKVKITDQDATTIKEKFRELTTIDYGGLTAVERLKLLSYLASGSMYGTYYNSENEEGFALKILKYADANQADDMIQGLEKPPVTLNDPSLKPANGSLIKNLTFKVDDALMFGVGGNNKKILTQSLVYLLSKSTSQFPARLNSASDKPDIIFVQNSYFAPTDKEAMMRVSYMIDGGKEISISQGHWEVEQKCEWVSDFGGDGQEECEITRQEIIWDSQIRVDPFDLVVVADESDMTLIEGISTIDAKKGDGTITVIPAIVVYYAGLEGDVRNIVTYLGNAADVATLVIPFSKIASAPKWLNRFFKFTDVFSKVNASVNLVVNNSEMKNDPAIKEVLETYNEVTLALNVSNLAIGVSRAAVSKFIRAVERREAKKILREIASTGTKEAKESAEAILKAADEFKRYGKAKTGSDDWWKAMADEVAAQATKLGKNVKSRLDAAAFERLSTNLADQAELPLWLSKDNKAVLENPKLFLEEVGDNMHDLIVENKYYIKYDLNDGRILLADVDGKYYAFAQEVSKPVISLTDNADQVIRSHILEKYEKLKNLIGLGGGRAITILGTEIVTSQSRISTFLGRFNPDISGLLRELGDFKNINLGEVPGGINILNRPSIYESIGDWWTAHNLPWLKRAVDRADDIFLATLPARKGEIIDASGNLIGAYARELEYLVSRNYRPKNISISQWEDIRYFFNEIPELGSKGKSHIFTGEINASGAAAGCHVNSALENGIARISPGTTVTQGPNGLFKAKIEIKDAAGNWIIKSAESTFYPKSWTDTKILNEIGTAFKNKVFKSGNTWEGLSTEGITIRFFLKTDGSNEIISAFPIF